MAHGRSAGSRGAPVDAPGVPELAGSTLVPATPAAWIALLFAFSPVLVDLARNLAAHPEDRVTLIAPLLFFTALRRSSAPDLGASWDGIGAIALGLGLELLGILTGSPSVARLGLPIACLGLARISGRPPIAVIALLFFAIPPPYSVVALASPTLETALAHGASFIVSTVGAPVVAVGSTVHGPSGSLVLYATDSGASLAFGFAGVGWYATLHAWPGFARAALRAALAAALALPAQLLVVTLTTALLGMGLRSTARFWLREGAWLVAILAAFAVVELRRAGRPIPHAGPSPRD